VCVPNGECEPACTDDTMCDGDEICHPDLGACTECSDDNDCVGRDGPLCDPDRLKCVDCLSASDCGIASPFCITGDCEECIQNTDCGAGQVCDDDLECRAFCDADAQCTDGDRGHCIVETGACVECVEDLHCDFDADKTVCIVDQCEECRVNEDCPPDNPICDTENNECGGG
jgi:Cys-rich repeat protein